MEFFQAAMLRRLGVSLSRSVTVLRVANIVLLVAALAFAVWVVALKGG